MNNPKKGRRLPPLPPGYKPGDAIIIPEDYNFNIQVTQGDMEEALRNGEIGDFYSPDMPEKTDLN